MCCDRFDLPRGHTLAPAAFIERVRSKGRSVVFAVAGSDELRFLDAFGAAANVGGERLTHIILREDARLVEVWEEFLHGTQYRIGLITGPDRLPVAEVEVKRFMIRHDLLLGLAREDVAFLESILGPVRHDD